MQQDAIARAATRLLPERAVASLEDWVAMGGGRTGLTPPSDRRTPGRDAAR